MSAHVHPCCVGSISIQIAYTFFTLSTQGPRVKVSCQNHDKMPSSQEGQHQHQHQLQWINQRCKGDREVIMTSWVANTLMGPIVGVTAQPKSFWFWLEPLEHLKASQNLGVPKLPLSSPPKTRAEASSIGIFHDKNWWPGRIHPIIQSTFFY